MGEAFSGDFEPWLLASRQGLLRTAYLLAGDPHTAEDLTASALAKVLLAWDRIDPERRDAYARRVLVNEHRSLWRRAFRRREVTTDAPPETAVSDPAYDGERAELWRLLDTLPRRQRAVLVLRYYEQLSLGEVAEVLGVSVGTVKSQSSRALARLREELGRDAVPADEGEVQAP